MKSHPWNTDNYSTILFSINGSLFLPFSLSHSNNNTCAHAQFLLGLSPFERFHPFRSRGRQLRSHPWLFVSFVHLSVLSQSPLTSLWKRISVHFSTCTLPHPDPSLTGMAASVPTTRVYPHALPFAICFLHSLIFLPHISFHDHFMTVLSWPLSVLITLQSCPPLWLPACNLLYQGQSYISLTYSPLWGTKANYWTLHLSLNTIFFIKSFISWILTYT